MSYIPQHNPLQIFYYNGLNQVRPVRKSDKDVILKNQVMAFCEQEPLTVAMEIDYNEALNFWMEVWKAVEMCMVCILTILLIQHKTQLTYFIVISREILFPTHTHMKYCLLYN